jgi:hypothetical protein
MGLEVGRANLGAGSRGENGTKGNVIEVGLR